MASADYHASYAKFLVRDQLVRELDPNTNTGEPLDGTPFQGEPSEGVPPIPLLPSNPPTRHHLPPSRNDDFILPPPNVGKTTESYKVCIVGAGMAGIYTAYLLDALGFSYDILESSDRAGGRVLTHRFSDVTHDYYDAGAMRFPDNDVMKRFFDFCDATKTQRVPYYYSDGTVKCPVLYNGITSVKPVQWLADPFQICAETGIPTIDPTQILQDAMRPYVTALQEDEETGFDKLMTVDEYSTRDYLRDNYGINSQTMEYIECMNGYTDYFCLAFSEGVLQNVNFGTKNWKCIEGGADVLTQNALRILKRKPEYKKRVTEIRMRRRLRIRRFSIPGGGDQAKSENNKVPPSSEPSGGPSGGPAGGSLSEPPDNSQDLPIRRRRPPYIVDDVMEVTVAGESAPRRYDMVICTPTLACVQRMNLDNAYLNWGQKTAIRALVYTPSMKVAIKFSRPWWITDCGITSGGLGSTDEPLRVCVYPSYNLHDGEDKPAVLLCSYTWTQDSLRTGALVTRESPEGEEELLELMLKGLARLHGDKLSYEDLQDLYVTHHSYDWYKDPNTAGAVAGFRPGQFSQLYPFLTRPAAGGLLSFAGEAISSHHGWILGAMDSAWRSVYQFLYRYNLRDKIFELVEKFGIPPEVEIGVNGTEHLQIFLGARAGVKEVPLEEGEEVPA